MERKPGETLGEYLKRVRESRGFSQRYLSHLSGVSNTTISRIEKNKTKIPDLPTLKALAKALDISEEYLFDFANGNFPAGVYDNKEESKGDKNQTPADANKETATDEVRELLLLAQNLQEEDLKLLKQIAKRLSK